jgi:hypothetical protein
MKRFIICGILFATPVMAQDLAPATVTTAVVPAPVAIIQSNATPNVLRAGAEVPLVTREELTTKKKKLRVGQRFQMAVSGDVTQNGVVIIPSGTPAIGEITEIRNKGMWGKSGYIGARAVSLRLGERYVRLTGNFDDKGITGTGGVIAAVALIPIAGFITTGTSAFIASGSGVKSFLDEDIAFQTVPAAAPTLLIPIPAVEPAVVDADVPPTP